MSIRRRIGIYATKEEQAEMRRQVEQKLVEIAQDNPHMQKLLYPRKFRVPASHFDPLDILKGWMGLIYYTNYATEDAQSEKALQQYLGCLLRCCEEEMPTWFVGEDFFKAISMTDPPTLPLTEVPWARDAMLFVFPKPKVATEILPVTHMLIAKCPTNSHSKITFGGKLALEVLFTGDIPTLTIASSPCIFDYGKGWATWYLKCGIQADQKTDYFFSPLKEFSDTDFTEEDKQETNKLGRIAINLMLSLAEPSILQQGSLLVPPVVSGKGETKVVVKPGLWEPKWVGKNYRLPRNELGGTHASPRMHWRKGHWRHQKCGPALQKEKLVWISPVLVAKPKET